MKSITLFILCMLFAIMGYSQTDTISSNIYQTNKKLGIGIINPFAPFSVYYDSNYISPNENTILADLIRSYNGSDARFCVYGYPDTYNVAEHMRKSIMLYATGDAKDMIICASQPQGKIRFFTQTWANPNSERMRIDSIGRIGIGTTAPKAKLQIADGDIYISDINKGIIMKSPNGNCWRGTLNSDGVLVFEIITCPEDELVRTDDFREKDNLLLYPNPGNESVTIDAGSDITSNLHYRVFDVNGREVMHGRNVHSKFKLNISNLDSGIYVVELTEKNGQLINTARFIRE